MCIHDHGRNQIHKHESQKGILRIRAFEFPVNKKPP